MSNQNISHDPRLTLPWYRLNLGAEGTLIVTPLSLNTSKNRQLMVCRDASGKIHWIHELLFKRLARRVLPVDVAKLMPSVSESALKHFSSLSLKERWENYFNPQVVCSSHKGNTFGSNVQMKMIRHRRSVDKVEG